MTASGMNVVIVDSQPNDYESLSQSSDSSLRLRVLSSGRDALHIANGEPIDAWIINVRLPDMTGFELHEVLRERFPAARFVLVSDGYSGHDELKARASGAVRYLCKPPQTWWLEHVKDPGDDRPIVDCGGQAALDRARPNPMDRALPGSRH